MKKTMFSCAFKLGSIVAFGILIGSNFAFAANPILRCSLDMYQFKADSKMFPLIGDSNQNLVFEMKDDGQGGLRGEAQARFANDQSQDDSNSLHGVKAIAVYSEGNGLIVSMGILNYENSSDESKYKVIAAVGSSSYDEEGLEKNAEKLQFGYVNPKAYDPQPDLFDLMKKGVVKDYELYLVTFDGCHLVD